MILLYILLIILVIVSTVFICMRFNFNRVSKYFKQGNVCVTGLRGTGKDMLTANVISRRKNAYISNIDYKCKKSLFIPLELDKLNIANNYDNFIKGEFIEYNYPYPENCDIYVSDCGVYFPSQYTNTLDRKYNEFPMFQALSRQLGNCNFHINAQNLNRVWNKIREQSDIYITCNKCKVIFGYVFQTITVYDKYESCTSSAEPYIPIKAPPGTPRDSIAEYKARDQVAHASFKEKNGTILRFRVLYKNKSCYDTRYFKKVLRNGRKNDLQSHYNKDIKGGYNH